MTAARVYKARTVTSRLRPTTSKVLAAAAALAIAIGVVVAAGAPQSGAQAALQAWVQLGADLNAEAPGDHFGTAVSVSGDGSTVVVGAPRNDGGFDSAGHVRVFRLSGTTWAQLGGDIDGETYGDESGTAVGVSDDGTTIAIGAPYNDGADPLNRNSMGHVRVLRWNGASWIQLGSDIDGETDGDWSGEVLALSADGNTVAIGAPRNLGTSDNSFNPPGHVRVFRWNGASWTQLGADIDGDNAAGSGSAVALSADGNRVIIGAAQAANYAGQARVLGWNGTSWTKLGADINGASNSTAGGAVDMSADGNIVIVGMPNANFSTGLVRIFRWNGASWIQRGSSIVGDEENEYFGTSVSMSADGKTIVAGAEFNDDAGFEAGQARVFRWNGTAWSPLGNDIDGTNKLDFFGSSVAISADASTVIVGAVANYSPSGEYAGFAQVFRLQTVTRNCQNANFTVNMNTNGGNGIGTAGPDAILGTPGVDVIDGLGGNDLICGGGSRDIINGGDGDDLIYGGGGSDTVQGGAGNDTIYGQFGGDTIRGGSGNDRILGGPGYDTLYGQDGDDNVQGAGGNDTLWGGAGNDKLFGKPGNDAMYGEDGNDELYAASGNDTLSGGAGNDRLQGAAGDDQIEGGDGDDVLYGQTDDDIMNGNAGNDTLYGAAGDDTLRGGSGNDDLQGANGNDVLYGEGGVDILYGQAGTDLLDGGPAADTCWGSAADTLRNC